MFRLFLWMTGFLIGVFPLRAGQEVAWEKALYVSPAGSGAEADGSREKPFGSIRQALERLSGPEPATIALLSGTYTGRVELPPSSATGPLLLAAGPGQEVVFEGGSPVREWEPYPRREGHYVFKAGDVNVAYTGERGWLDVWEAGTKTRYRIQRDAAGVSAYPGSACLLDPSTVLVHTRDGTAPGALGLWRNREGNGIDIARDRVTVRGITFRNYCGGRQARAVTIKGKNVALEDCVFFNCVRGVSAAAPDARIENCRFEEVAQGITGVSADLTVRGCVMESASGPFAFGVFNDHMRNGIRLYHPAEGAVVERNVTRGFWAGLYIKTSPPPDAARARPFLVRHNTFLDGIRWGGGQSLARYSLNLIGPDEEGVDIAAALPELGAVLRANYFFNGRPSGADGNVSGPVPFADFEKGDLRIRDGVALPRENGAEAGAGIAQVRWQAAPSHSPGTGRADGPPELLAPPVCVASAKGALVTARLSRPAKGVIRYRLKDGKAWKAGRGVDNNPARGKVRGSPARPETPETPDQRGYSLSFFLADGRLEADADYEFFLEFTTEGHPSLKSAVQSFRTSGDPREIFVAAGGEGDGAGERPFGQIQEALDRALPGDVIHVGPGVYTLPAVLTHGGAADAPLTLVGAGMKETILDGGKVPPVLLEIREAEEVKVRGIQFRWFGKAGLAASDSRKIEIDQCFFQNGKGNGGGINGCGVVLNRSPQTTISGSVFTRLEYGVKALDSPALEIRDNTAALNLYSSVYLAGSSRGSRVMGNSFTFTGNLSLRITEPDAEAFASLVCDFNNYAARLEPPGEIALRAYAAAGVVPREPEVMIEPAAHYGLGSQGKSKRIVDARVGGAVVRYFRMDDWRKASGKDAHSIFADPLYADPLNGDFALLPESPNALPGGRVIGALPVRK